MDELEDGDEVLREVRGEEEEGRSGSSTSSGENPGRRSPGEEASRTVSPLSKLKVTLAIITKQGQKFTLTFHPCALCSHIVHSCFKCQLCPKECRPKFALFVYSKKMYI